MRITRMFVSALAMFAAACGEGLPHEEELTVQDGPELATKAQAIVGQYVIYDEALGSNWVDWSWSTTRQFANTSPVHSGKHSLSVRTDAAYGGLYLRNNYGVVTAGYSKLQFRASSSHANGRYFVALVDSSGRAMKWVDLNDVGGAPAAGGKWTTYAVPLSTMNAANKPVFGFYLQGDGKDVGKTVYLDGLVLVGDGTQPPPEPVVVKSKTIPPAQWTGPLTDAQALAKVRKAAEKRPENAAVLKRFPTAAELATFYSKDAWNLSHPQARDWQKRITGNPGRVLTTDELIQWGAWKWGIDEDLLRSVVTQESWWKMSALGDWTTDWSLCPPDAAVRPAANGNPAQCAQSYGLTQMKYSLHGKNVWPLTRDSAPFVLDYIGAHYRMIWHGMLPWLSNMKPQPGYPAYPSTRPEDVYGAVGNWYSGLWFDPMALEYIGLIKGHYNSRIWEQVNF